jgi:hypothetical protein
LILPMVFGTGCLMTSAAFIVLVLYSSIENSGASYRVLKHTRLLVVLFFTIQLD